MPAIVFVLLVSLAAGLKSPSGPLKPRRISLVAQHGAASASASAVGIAAAKAAGNVVGKKWSRRQDHDFEAQGDNPAGLSADHFLTDSELTNTSSVPCLQMRQQNPAIKCDGSGASTLGGSALYTGEDSGLNIGSYPNWRDKKCHSHGEFFCDPDGLLDDKERASLVDELRALRNTTQVTCGRLLNDSVDDRHLQSFYLGVALAGSSWQGGLDPDSLQAFGQVVASQWQLDRLHVGPEMLYASCPSVAMLLLFPGSRRAFVSSPSCEFICKDRGGPEVEGITLTALDAGGIAAAVRAGIKEVHRVISKAPPMSEANDVSAKKKKDTDADMAQIATIWELGQRLVFGVVCCALIFSLVAGGLVLVSSPRLVSGKDRY